MKESTQKAWNPLYMSYWNMHITLYMIFAIFIWFSFTIYTPKEIHCNCSVALYLCISTLSISDIYIDPFIPYWKYSIFVKCPHGLPLIPDTLHHNFTGQYIWFQSTKLCFHGSDHLHHNKCNPLLASTFRFPHMLHDELLAWCCNVVIDLVITKWQYSFYRYFILSNTRIFIFVE